MCIVSGYELVGIEFLDVMNYFVVKCFKVVFLVGNKLEFIRYWNILFNR